MRRIRGFGLAGLAIVAVILLLDVTLAIYHLTHGGGWGSGIAELALAGMLVAAVSLVFHSQRKKDSLGRRSRSWLAGMAIIGLVACVVLFLGVYHLTHNGLPSGIIELSMTGLLVIVGYLIASPRES